MNSEELEALVHLIDRFTGEMFFNDAFRSENAQQWHGYYCGYVRGIREFVSRGPDAVYRDLYEMSTYSDYFHEGVVTALSSCMRYYDGV